MPKQQRAADGCVVSRNTPQDRPCQAPDLQWIDAVFHTLQSVVSFDTTRQLPFWQRPEQAFSQRAGKTPSQPRSCTAFRRIHRIVRRWTLGRTCGAFSRLGCGTYRAGCSWSLTQSNSPGSCGFGTASRMTFGSAGSIHFNGSANWPCRSHRKNPS